MYNKANKLESANKIFVMFYCVHFRLNYILRSSLSENKTKQQVYILQLQSINTNQ